MAGPVADRPAPPLDTVLGRTMQLLEAFEADDLELGLSELARRSGVAKPTVHRLAGQLVALGLLERSGQCYRLSTRLFELGQRVPRHRVLRDAALPFMEDLYVATRETVHLAVPQHGEVLYLERIAGHQAAPSRTAGRLPLHCTATGKAMLAFSPELRSIVARSLERRTPYTIVAPNVLAGQLCEVRKSGVAVERDETRLGYTSVAAPLFAARDQLVGALSVTGPSSRVDPDRLTPGVRTAALGLSRALRSTPASTLRGG